MTWSACAFIASAGRVCLHERRVIVAEAALLIRRERIEDPGFLRTVAAQFEQIGDIAGRTFAVEFHEHWEVA